MKEVVCWCCENFDLLKEMVVLNDKLVDGICKNNCCFCHSEDSQSI